MQEVYFVSGTPTKLDDEIEREAKVLFSRYDKDQNAQLDTAEFCALFLESNLKTRVHPMWKSIHARESIFASGKPDNATIGGLRYAHGIMLQTLGAYDAAVCSLEKAVGLLESAGILGQFGPKICLTDAYHALAASLQLAGCYNRSMEFFDKAIGASATPQAAHYFNRGCAKYYMGSVREALDDFDTTIELSIPPPPDEKAGLLDTLASMLPARFQAVYQIMKGSGSIGKLLAAITPANMAKILALVPPSVLDLVPPSVLEIMKGSGSIGELLTPANMAKILALVPPSVLGFAPPVLVEPDEKAATLLLAAEVAHRITVSAVSSRKHTAQLAAAREALPTNQEDAITAMSVQVGEMKNMDMTGLMTMFAQRPQEDAITAMSAQVGEMKNMDMTGLMTMFSLVDPVKLAQQFGVDITPHAGQFKSILSKIEKLGKGPVQIADVLSMVGDVSSILNLVKPDEGKLPMEGTVNPQAAADAWSMRRQCFSLLNRVEHAEEIEASGREAVAANKHVFMVNVDVGAELSTPWPIARPAHRPAVSGDGDDHMWETTATGAHWCDHCLLMVGASSGAVCKGCRMGIHISCKNALRDNVCDMMPHVGVSVGDVVAPLQGATAWDEDTLREVVWVRGVVLGHCDIMGKPSPQGEYARVEINNFDGTFQHTFGMRWLRILTPCPCPLSCVCGLGLNHTIHRLKTTSIHRPRWCDVCTEFICGGSAMQCSDCPLRVHTECASKVVVE